MRPLHDCRLYGILDLGYVETSDAARIVEQMVEGGVDLFGEPLVPIVDR